MIKVIIVDDHQIFVDGVKVLLQEMDAIEVIGQANDGIDLLMLLQKESPDVILMDVNMPNMNGVEATKKVVSKYPDIKILMLTMHDNALYIEKLIKAGAHGYILKNTGKTELYKAIQTVMNGQPFYSAAVTQRIMEGLQKKKKVAQDVMHVQLTDREKQVIVLIAQEFTTNEIAEKLFISHHTVESHRKNLISKLQVRGTSGLVKYAIQSGLSD